MLEDNRVWIFSLEEALWWIMDSYFGHKQWFKVKKCLNGWLFCTNMQLFASQYINKWIIVMFLSAVWRHLFDAEDPLHLHLRLRLVI